MNINDIIGTIVPVLGAAGGVVAFIAILIAVLAGAGSSGDVVAPPPAPQVSVVAPAPPTTQLPTPVPVPRPLPATTAPVAVPVPSGPSVAVNQGDRISINNEGSICTLGYVDHANHTAYTAAHCLDTDRDATTRETNIAIYNTTQPRRIIGYATVAANYGSVPYYAHDVAKITLLDDVIAGTNTYSGDTVIGPGDINTATDRVCRYGATSTTVYCDPISRTNELHIISASKHLIPGDSGGPTWITDNTGAVKGFIAIHSGYIYASTSYPNGADRGAFLNGTTW